MLLTTLKEIIEPKCKSAVCILATFSDCFLFYYRRVTVFNYLFVGLSLSRPLRIRDERVDRA